MGKIGMPVMKLKGGNGFGKHAGNALFVAMEALEERRSSDEDLDRSLTGQNVYVGNFQSGYELYRYWQSEAENYRVIDKNGNSKKLRSDASIGFTQIIKPDAEMMRKLSLKEQFQLLYDTLHETVKEYKKRKVVIDCCVIHVDEGVLHMHIFGHDPEYKLGKKLNLKFYNALNRSVPKRLRQRGWNVEDCVSYDVDAVSKMSEDEVVEYKKKHIQNKQGKHGLSSKEYKAGKKAEQLGQLESDLKRQQSEMDQERERLSRTKALVDKARKQAEETYKQAEETYKQAEEAEHKYREKLERLDSLWSECMPVLQQSHGNLRVVRVINNKLQRDSDGKLAVKGIQEVVLEANIEREKIEKRKQSLYEKYSVTEDIDFQR